MIEFRPYLPEHLRQLEVQPAQRQWLARYGEPGYPEMLVSPYAWSGFVDGAVVGCSGIVTMWEGRGYAWCIFGDIPRPAWVPIVSKIRRVVKDAQAAGFQRIETTVPAGFGAGCRLASASEGMAKVNPTRTRKPSRMEINRELMMARGTCFCGSRVSSARFAAPSKPVSVQMLIRDENASAPR